MPEVLDKEFLYYFLLSQKRSFIKAGKGGAQPNISQGIIKEWPINLPPLNEQHRIVAKIEELFSELDKGIENLKTARAQLKVYRQALLKHAFEGKLTAQWRAERRVTPAKAGVQPLNDMDSRLRGNDESLETATALLARIQTEREQHYQQQLRQWDQSKSPSVPLLQSGKTSSAAAASTVPATASIPHFAKGGLGGISEGRGEISVRTAKPKAPKPLPPLTAKELAELPELPEGWAWARLSEACELVVDCHNKTAPYQASGIPLVRTPSIRDMKLNFDESIRYVSNETYQFWSKRCPPLPGDILFTREAPMGEAAIIPEGKMVCMGQRIMLLRPGNFLSSKYLLCATQAPLFKKISDEVAVGTGVKHLRVGDVERLIFPICSKNEQIEIANQLDARLSEADQLELTLTTSLQQAETLRQSILKRAFSGQLVAQDANEEPAAALLARIRAERDVQAKSSKARGAK